MKGPCDAALRVVPIGHQPSMLSPPMTPGVANGSTAGNVIAAAAQAASKRLKTSHRNEEVAEVDKVCICVNLLSAKRCHSGRFSLQNHVHVCVIDFHCCSQKLEALLESSASLAAAIHCIHPMVGSNSAGKSSGLLPGGPGLSPLLMSPPPLHVATSTTTSAGCPASAGGSQISELANVLSCWSKEKIESWLTSPPPGAPSTFKLFIRLRHFGDRAFKLLCLTC